jgi:hypothetical protein
LPPARPPQPGREHNPPRVGELAQDVGGQAGDELGEEQLPVVGLQLDDELR